MLNNLLLKLLRMHYLCYKVKHLNIVTVGCKIPIALQAFVTS